MKQVVPPSITGLVDAPAASVVDHKFGAGDPYTLGVEEEYMLLDPESFDLVQHIETVLDAVQGDELADRINAELMQSVLEIATPVCTTAGDVMRELTTLRGYVRDVGARAGPARRLGRDAPVQPLRAPADHREGPLPRPDRPAPVRRPPRADLRDAHPRRRRRPRQGDPGRQRAAAPPRAAARALGELAVLARASRRGSRRAARSSSRPSRARGRRRASATTPTTPASSASSSARAASPTTRTSGGTSAPIPKWGTIEVRICDAVTRLEDAVAIAAYCQAVVKAICERYEAGDEVPTYHRILTSENKWLAARYGLEAPVMDLATGRRIRIPLAKLVRRTLREIEPHARELGSERELEGIAEILGRGNSAERQLRVFNANRDIVEVVRAIADATEQLPASASRVASDLERPRLGSDPESRLRRARVAGGQLARVQHVTSTSACRSSRGRRRPAA